MTNLLKTGLQSKSFAVTFDPRSWKGKLYSAQFCHPETNVNSFSSPSLCNNRRTSVRAQCDKKQNGNSQSLLFNFFNCFINLYFNIHKY